MSLINEFVKKVLQESDSFSITLEDPRMSYQYYYFLQGNVGKARYIYGIRNFRSELFYADTTEKPELVAIFSDGVVYIVDELFFGLRSWDTDENNSLPEKTVFFSSLKEEKNEYICKTLFAEFYAGLKVNDITNVDTINNCRKEAREYLLAMSPMTENNIPAPSNDEKFSNYDVACTLCGLIDFEEEAKRRFEINKPSWIYVKSCKEMVLELMKDSSTAYKWEILIAEGLRSVNAKTVMVEFELNGKKASAKMSPERLVRALIRQEKLSDYNFEVSRQGAHLLISLGVTSLKCENISKITYGKRILYVKE